MDWITELGWQGQGIAMILFGASLRYIRNFMLWIVRRMGEHVMKGVWWEYHYSSKRDDTIIFESKLRVKSGIRERLVFRMEQEGGLAYKGMVLEEKGSSQFFLRAKSLGQEHEEYMVFRYELPLKPNPKVVAGLTVSYNHNKSPYAAVSILTRKRQNKDKVAQLLPTLLEKVDGIPVMNIKKNPETVLCAED